MANTSKCRNGSVGSVYSDDDVTLTLENGIDNVTVDTALTGAGGKIQNASGITFGAWIAWDASKQNDAYGISVIDSDRVNIGSVIVKDYDCASGFTGHAFVIDGGTHVNIGAVTVTGTICNAGSGRRDMIITTADNVYIGQVTLASPVGTVGGFLYDYDAGFAPQRDINIDAMYSKGHTGYDVTVENKSAIKIGHLNTDAVEEFPNNRNNMAEVRASTWTPTLSRTSSVITYSTQEGFYTVIGKTVTAHFNLTVGAVTTQGSGYWVVSLPIAARTGYTVQHGSLGLRAAASGTLGLYVQSAQTSAFLIASTGTDAYNGALSTGTLAGTITYMID